MAALSITVSPVGRAPSFAKGLPITINLPEDDTIADVKKAIELRYPKFYVARQKISLKGDRKALSDEDQLQELEIKDGAELTVKDLGPQISWRTVFLIEYVGPLLIHPIFYFSQKLVYGKTFEHSLMQKYVFTMVLLHYAKRELETIFVHRFSHGTMPFRNVFKNSFHYHILEGFMMAYPIYAPKYGAFSLNIRGTPRNELPFLWFWVSAFVFAELSNLASHIKLRNLRPEGTRTRAIPFGYGFNLVTCPNYFFESLAWFSVCFMSGDMFAWIFLAVSTGQMLIWAKKKHRAYKKEFGDKYPKGRKMMIPFLY
ncbi:hypothetical protein SCHPADRAFT_874581 [Schizopora paradoxa]|uniref:very-long-chain enoyl-CoA reductase n=1 Tax=Schizopora paradoxa TaxID=27342 RepID=A0A0H2RMD4_9AGAM|nr:hypothetical protein SCHPADRAFT_874581 [Schizopora paradoxa]